MSVIRQYLDDPFLKRLYEDIRKAGAIRSVSLDITSRCNLRCTGCYYFEEGMDKFQAEDDEQAFDSFIEHEKYRVTNFITVVGDEPTLVLHRLKKIYENFKMNVATNGLIRIPYEEFENMPVGIAIWGNHKTDSLLRGNGKKNFFQ